MTASRRGRTAKRRWSRVVDVTLLAGAILSAAWVFWRMPVPHTLYQPCELAAGEQASASDLTIYVDDSNRIHVGSQLIQSDAELIARLPSPPGRVRLLVHPDGLFENVMRTVEMLRRAGASQYSSAQRAAPLEQNTWNSESGTLMGKFNVSFSMRGDRCVSARTNRPTSSCARRTCCPSFVVSSS